MRDWNLVYRNSTLSTSPATKVAYTASAIAWDSVTVMVWPTEKERVMLYWGRLKYCSPFFPTRIRSTSMPASVSSAYRSSVCLMMKLLKPPKRPRSPVQEMSATRFTGRTSARGESTFSPLMRWLTP